MFFENIAPAVFRNDAFVLIQLILFSVSCGYLASLGMYYGSTPDVSFPLLKPIVRLVTKA